MLLANSADTIPDLHQSLALACRVVINFDVPLERFNSANQRDTALKSKLPSAQLWSNQRNVTNERLHRNTMLFEYLGVRRRIFGVQERLSERRWVHLREVTVQSRS
jgi:hypothetical protein